MFSGIWWRWIPRRVTRLFHVESVFGRRRWLNGHCENRVHEGATIITCPIWQLFWLDSNWFMTSIQSNYIRIQYVSITHCIHRWHIRSSWFVRKNFKINWLFNRWIIKDFFIEALLISKTGKEKLCTWYDSQLWILPKTTAYRYLRNSHGQVILIFVYFWAVHFFALEVYKKRMSFLVVQFVSIFCWYLWIFMIKV